MLAARSKYGSEARSSLGAKGRLGLALGWCMLKSPSTRVGVGELVKILPGRSAAEGFHERL